MHEQVIMQGTILCWPASCALSRTQEVDSCNQLKGVFFMIKIKFRVNRASVLWSQYTLCWIKLECFKNKNSWQDSKLVRTVIGSYWYCKSSRGLYEVKVKKSVVVWKIKENLFSYFKIFQFYQTKYIDSKACWLCSHKTLS